MQYIVISEPKAKYRAGFNMAVMITEAKSAAEARRNASLRPEMKQSGEYKALHVEPLQNGKLYFF